MLVGLNIKEKERVLSYEMCGRKQMGEIIFLGYDANLRFYKLESERGFKIILKEDYIQVVYPNNYH